MPGVKLGLDAKLYYKVGGQAGGGAWTELTNCRDLTLSLEKGQADVTTRANQGWRAKKGTLKEASVEFEMLWKPADAGFNAIKNVFLGTAEYIGFQVLDGANGEGLQADFDISNFSRSEPLEEGITVSVTAEVTESGTPPTWLEAS